MKRLWALLPICFLTIAWSPFPNAEIPGTVFHAVTLRLGCPEYNHNVRTDGLPSTETKVIVEMVPERFGDMHSACLVDAPCRGWWRAIYPHPDKRYTAIVLYFAANSYRCLLIEERPKAGRGFWWYAGDKPSDTLQEDAIKYLNNICEKGSDNGN